jgi:hypothetical protein
VADPEGESSDPAFLAFRKMAKDGSWFDHDSDGPLDSIAFGFSHDEELATSAGCIGEHAGPEEDVPGSGVHAIFDFCITTYKAFHNDIPGAYGVNEHFKVFSAGTDLSSRSKVVAEMKEFIADMAKASYQPPNHEEL